MEDKEIKVGFFILPGQENFVEDILNDPHCVIITKKEEINKKDSCVLIYIEWEQHK